MTWLTCIPDYGIMGLMTFLSLVSLAMFVERWLFLRRIDPGTHEGSRRALEIGVTRKPGIVASIGSDAPYVGLPGTVPGVMVTFYATGTEGYADASRIMVGLALAPKTTALGLAVAIPSVVFYNALSRRAKVILLEWDDRHG